MRPRSIRPCVRPRSRQRGVALLLVLWACTLLAILLGGYAMLARTEGLQARYQFAQTRAHYAAEAGLTRAIYGLQDPVAPRRWLADGRAYVFHFDDASVSVTCTDEGGKVDLNSASPEVLQRLFQAAGQRADAAHTLAAAVADWRNYSTDAGLPAIGTRPGGAPRHAPFASVEELQQVPGMTAALYRAIASQITIWSGRESPDPDTASSLALAAIPGMTPPQASAIAAARVHLRPGAGLVASNGTTHSIRAVATLSDGTRAVLGATIRLQGIQATGQPYTVLRWQEGDRE